jgi:Thioredoxin
MKVRPYLWSIPVLAGLLTVALESARPTTAVAVYAQAQTFEEFIDTVLKPDAGRQMPVPLRVWEESIDRAHTPPVELVRRLRGVSAGLKLLAIVEPSCTDSAHTVPYLASLSQAAQVGFRLATRREGGHLLSLYLTPDGREATPTILLLRTGRIVGAWVERPSALQFWVLASKGRMTSGELARRRVAWYDWNRGEAAMTEVVSIAERTALPK